MIKEIKVDTKKIEQSVSSINDKINSFQDKLDSLPRAVDHEMKEVVTDLKIKQAALENHFRSIKSAGVGIYGDVHAGVELAIRDLNEAYQSAKDRLEKLVA